MRAVAALPRRAWTQLRHEVLVLPGRSLVLFGCAALLLLPLAWDDPYLLRVITMTSIFAIYAASWDLLSGYSGQVNFGHALFFGVGAYTSALLGHHLGWTPWLTMPIACVAAMLAGLLAGIPCLRLRGSYLSLATLAFPLILTGLLFAFPGFSGGELGVSGLKRLAIGPTANYYLAVVPMLASVLILWAIGDSNTGLILHAIREDEVACRASGINTPRYKLLAFVLAALFAGLSGAMFAHYMRVAGPSTLDVGLSFQAVIWGVFGGVATTYGPVIAVFLLYPLTEMLATFEVFREIRQLIFAGVVLLVLLFMPRGLVPWIRDRMETECPRCKQRNSAHRNSCRLCAAVLR